MLNKIKNLFKRPTSSRADANIEMCHLIFLQSAWDRLRFGIPLVDPNNEREVIKLFGHPGGKYDQR